jgi:putative membrane protein
MLNKWQGIAAATACSTLVAFTACSKGNRNNADSAAAAAASGEVARTDTAATAMAPSAGATAAATTPGSTGNTSAMKITGGDPEILQVLAVVDQSEVRDGQLAERMARSAKVKSFARELVADHSKSLQQDRQIAKSANIDLSGVMMSGSNKTSGTPKTGTDTSRSAAASAAQPGTAGASGATGVVAELVNMHTQAMDQVRQLKGAAFDSAFVNAQIQGHQQVLSLLQSAQAQNSSLQQHVTAATKGVQEHLDKGQQLQQSLTSGASGAMSDTTSKSKSKSDTGKAKSDTGRRG